MSFEEQTEDTRLFPHLCSYMAYYLFQGGKLVYLYTKKRGSVPKCGDCKKKLQGVRNYLRAKCGF